MTYGKRPQMWNCRMTDQLPHRACCINIEVAHLRSWESTEALLSAEESLLIANEYRHTLDQPRPDAAFSVLIDDKALQISDRQSWLEDVYTRWPHIFAQIDFLCFESDLSNIADLVISQLVTRNRGRRAREIERYRNKHGRVACSHDIAIWHSLRLGMLGYHDNLITRGPNWKAGANFYCSHIVSILEEENREEEIRAAEIMREFSSGNNLNVETIFYAP